MNAKKTSILILMSSAMVLLGSCGTTTSSSSVESSVETSTSSTPVVATRADALTALDAMDAVVKAASYTKPTTLKVSVKTAANVVTKTTEVNVAANFAHTVYAADVLDKSSNVTTAAGTEVFAYKDGDSFYVVKKVGEVVTGFSSTTDFGVVAAISAKIDGSNGLGSAAYMAKYIRNFADGATGLVTGATVKAGAYMKAEAYTITSAGNIVLDITPNYGYDEHMIYTYTDNKVASVFNKTTTTSEWGASVTATLPTVTPATFDATAAAALLKLC